MNSNNNNNDTTINSDNMNLSDHNNHNNNNLSNTITCRRCKGTKPGLQNTLLIPCGNKECDKMHHFVCFQSKYPKQDWYNNIPTDDLSIFCTKKCFTSLLKTTTMYGWKNDCKEGKDDPNHSFKYLLKWITTGTNWIRYKGDEKTGQTKKNLLLLRV